MNRAFWLRLIVLFALALVPLALFVATTPQEPSQLREVAQRTANELDRLLQLRAQQVFTVAAFPSIRAFAASTAETRSERAAVALNELQAWVASDTNVREAFITDGLGMVIMTTREGWNSEAGERKFVRDALGGQIAISPIAKDRDEYSNYYAAPVLNNSKEIAGALVIRVAAQELWEPMSVAGHYVITLSDENGVRLEDSGEPALRLVSFGALEPDRASEILDSQMYGSQLPIVRATRLERAQQMIEEGAIEQLSASDFDMGRLATQRLVSKPWVVLVTTPALPPMEQAGRYAAPVAVALVLALCGAILLARV
jgi:hypothetical protein